MKRSAGLLTLAVEGTSGYPCHLDVCVEQILQTRRGPVIDDRSYIPTFGKKHKRSAGNHVRFGEDL